MTSRCGGCPTALVYSDRLISRLPSAVIRCAIACASAASACATSVRVTSPTRNRSRVASSCLRRTCSLLRATSSRFWSRTTSRKAVTTAVKTVGLDRKGLRAGGLHGVDRLLGCRFGAAAAIERLGRLKRHRTAFKAVVLRRFVAGQHAGHGLTGAVEPGLGVHGDGRPPAGERQRDLLVGGAQRCALRQQLRVVPVGVGEGFGQASAPPPDCRRSAGRRSRQSPVRPASTTADRASAIPSAAASTPSEHEPGLGFKTRK